MGHVRLLQLGRLIAMAATAAVTYKLSLCADCVYTDANGWDEAMTGAPLPTPAPLSLLSAGTLLGPDSDCEYGEAHFSWAPCQGCGCALGGDRYCYVGADND